MGGKSAAKRAAEKQAQAMREQTAAMEKRAKDLAYASQMQQESMIKRQKAAEEADQLLKNQKQQDVEVDVEPEDPELPIDPTSGRRKRLRETYRDDSKTRMSGIKI